MTPADNDGIAPLTEATIIEARAKLESQTRGRRPLVGIVCRPDCKTKLLGMLANVKKGGNGAAIIGMDGQPISVACDWPVFTDDKQEEPMLMFFDFELLKAYLTRYENKAATHTAFHQRFLEALRAFLKWERANPQAVYFGRIEMREAAENHAKFEPPGARSGQPDRSFYMGIPIFEVAEDRHLNLTRL